jgi:hypothetical protein
LEAFYNKVFVDGGLAVKELSVRFVEKPLDHALNVGVPVVFTGIHTRLKKMQTGMLPVNMLYLILLLVAALLVLLGLGVL